MKWYEILLLLIVVLGSINIAYQVFKMTELDAASRGFKNPKLWGILASGGQNGGGLMLYLLGRRKYPSTMSENEKREIESRKNKIAIGLIFSILGAIGLIIVIFLK
ncbi:hypothetical protein [Clostridium botulinum]|uniref:hypothetical protein n=1 Tax=Clostridium botulinum TaxID=1491 RepID=UPI001E2E7426|nr:hypothetical protein [Clostridium botulinum]MCC5437463.1 hypothetical protein [Clostridium botulinum]NFR57432.1 hypothetical protein [Clostridium botulinum]